MGDGNSVEFKLGTFSTAGCKPFAGVVIDNWVLALNAMKPIAKKMNSSIVGTDTVLEFLEEWECNIDSLSRVVAAVREDNAVSLSKMGAASLDNINIHAPIHNPRQVICVGANYRKHVIELIVAQGIGQLTANMSKEGREIAAPKIVDARAAHGFPYAFSALSGAIIGPYDSITIPEATKQADWELELAVIVGRECYQVNESEALTYVAGYTVLNDITSRDLLYRNDMPGMDWLRSKCSPTYLPMGPFLTPAMFVRDPQNLKMELKLNGETMQDDSTSDMLFSVAKQIAYLSKHVKLLPGDVIATGSPAGNGISKNRFLNDGDVLHGRIEGLGELRNRCVSGSK